MLCPKYQNDHTLTIFYSKSKARAKKLRSKTDGKVVSFKKEAFPVTLNVYFSWFLDEYFIESYHFQHADQSVQVHIVAQYLKRVHGIDVKHWDPFRLWEEVNPPGLLRRRNRAGRHPIFFLDLAFLNFHKNGFHILLFCLIWFFWTLLSGPSHSSLLSRLSLHSFSLPCSFSIPFFLYLSLETISFLLEEPSFVFGSLQDKSCGSRFETQLTCSYSLWDSLFHNHLYQKNSFLKNTFCLLTGYIFSTSRSIVSLVVVWGESPMQSSWHLTLIWT